MKQYSTYEAKTKLSQLIKEALSGIEVVITNRDVPLVTLSPIRSRKSKKRRLGFLKDPVKLSADFDAELEDFKAFS